MNAEYIQGGVIRADTIHLDNEKFEIVTGDGRIVATYNHAGEHMSDRHSAFSDTFLPQAKKPDVFQHTVYFRFAANGAASHRVHTGPYVSLVETDTGSLHVLDNQKLIFSYAKGTWIFYEVVMVDA